MIHKRLGHLALLVLTCVMVNPLHGADGSGNQVIAGGANNSLVVASDGTVWVWGNNQWGESGDVAKISGSTGTTNPVLIAKEAVSGGPVTNAVGIVSGGNDSTAHTLILRCDGRILACGNNSRGQLGLGSGTASVSHPTLVTSLTNVVALAAGSSHSLAVKADGTVWAWGDNTYGQIGFNYKGGYYLSPYRTVISTNQKVKAVAAGNSHCVAMTADGRVWAWGRNDKGQIGDGTTTDRLLPVLLPVITNIIAIAAGGSRSMALSSDGTVFCWGYGENGGNGNGSLSDQKRPVQAIGLSNVVAIAAGGGHDLALGADGTIWGWGLNDSGQIGGAGNHVWGDKQLASRPYRIGSLAAVAVAAGQYHSLALKADGTVIAWGKNNRQQLGRFYVELLYGAESRVPFAVQNLGTVGLPNSSHVISGKSDGTVWAIGNNNYGQIGSGLDRNQELPLRIRGPLDVVSVSAGGAHSIAVGLDGKVWSWGWNAFGQLGNGETSNRNVPTRTSLNYYSNIVAVAAGGRHTLSLRSDGSVFTCGANDFGQVGIGEVFTGSGWVIGGLTNQSSPILITNGMAAIAGGGDHSLTLGSNGLVYAWGENHYGQLGDGTVDNRSTPVQVTNIFGIKQIACGRKFSLALSTNGVVWSWGQNQSGQLGQGTRTNVFCPTIVSGLSGVVAISAGCEHALALDGDGRIWVWGKGAYGQRGNLDLSDSPIPVELELIGPTAAIAAFGNSSFAVLTNGVVMAWGGGLSGQLGFGEGGNQSLPVNVADYWQIHPAYSAYQSNALTKTGRFSRPVNNTLENQSFVVPLQLQQGVALDDEGTTPTAYPGALPWFLRINKAYHWHLAQPGGLIHNGIEKNGYPYFRFDNPIVAFGSQGGGSPLYINEPTTFGVYAGGQSGTNSLPDNIIIKVYRKSDLMNGQSNVGSIGSISISLPLRDGIPGVVGGSPWSPNGLTTRTVEAYGLRTDVRLIPGAGAEFPGYGAAPQSAFMLTHTAHSSEYFYAVEASGYVPTTDPSQMTDWLVLEDIGILSHDYGRSWSKLYTLDFEQRPPWRTEMLAMPFFNDKPQPPAYLAKTPSELMTAMASVTNQFNLDGSEFVAIDQSPELRAHPTLDDFVLAMRNDPIALANYVINEIELSDAIARPAPDVLARATPGAAPYSINPGGVKRSALGTYLEGQGSPIEQCSLLIYLLRKSGYKAAYVFPTNNNIRMLDESLGKLLRMKIKGAKKPDGTLFTSNPWIIVNYPWVAAKIGTNVVHIFPWLKDTEVVEGLNVFDYLPTNYNSAFKWVSQYVKNDPAIIDLAPDANIPRILFPKFVEESLRQYHPGLSLDDMGAYFRDRRNYYSRWTDFPTPNVVTNSSQCVILDSLTSGAITNVSSSYISNRLFDTVTIDLRSNSTIHLSTGPMLMADVLNRRFIIYTNSPSSGPTIWLAPYRPGITGQSHFSDDPTLLNKQITNKSSLSVTVLRDVGITYNHNRFIDATDQWIDFYGTAGGFPGLADSTIFGPDSTAKIPLRKWIGGDVSGICLRAGRVSQKMLDLHMQDYWRMEQKRAADTNAPIPLEDSTGTAAYIIGMSYYKNCSESEELFETLLKRRLISRFSVGLAKLKQVDKKTAPSVDMLDYVVTSAGNNDLRPDAGQDFVESSANDGAMHICSGSAEEHNVLNSFFKTTNAISSVRLLQLGGCVNIDYIGAQQWIACRQSGCVSGYDVSGALWGEVLAKFSGPSATQTWAIVTPNNVSAPGNQFLGEGALIFAPMEWSAPISGNLNGGWGQQTRLFTPPVLGGSYASLVGGGLTPYSWVSWPPATGSYLPPVVSYSSAPSIGSAFGYTPAQSTYYSWSANLYNSPGLSYHQSFDLNLSSGNPGEVSWWGQLLSTIADPVNVVSGAFHIDATDLSLPGPMSMQLRRNYSSQNLSGINGFGQGWKMAYLPYLTVTTNTTATATNLIIYAAEMDGSVLAYRQQAAPDTNLFIPVPQDNPMLNNNSTEGAGSAANLFNARLIRSFTGTNITYQLASPDGSSRAFDVLSFELIATNHVITRTRPYLTTWQDCRSNRYTFSYGTNSASTDYGQVKRIESSNGNFLQFLYNSFGYIIEAFTGDGRHVYYEYDDYGDLVRVTLPDQSRISYEYHHYVVTNGLWDSDHLLLKELKPDGRVLENYYDDQHRVVVQKSTVGADLNTYTNALFAYTNNFQLTNSVTNLVSGCTIVTDCNGGTVRHDYTNGLITKITDQLGQTIQQFWYPDTATTPGYRRSLASVIDKRGLTNEFLYDTAGNITNKTVRGELTGEGTFDQVAVYTYGYNANNLMVTNADPVGNSVAITYDTVHPFLPATVVHLSAGTRTSTNKMDYYDVAETVTNGNTIYTNISYGLLRREIRAYNSPDAATNEWLHDGRGFVIQQTRYTGANDTNVVVNYFYNARGELVEQVDAAGRRTKMMYDGMGRLEQKFVFEAGEQLPLSQEFSYYNENGELVWADGPRYNPEDYIWRDYDGAGRKIQETRWRTRAKADGSGIEAETGDNLYATTFYEYDGYNNLERVTDSYGNYSRMAYDAVGQMIEKRFYGPNTLQPISVERFGYEPGGEVSAQTNVLGGVTYKHYTQTGKLKRQTNPDGSTLQWTYYLDGRPKREYLANSNYWDTAYDDVNRTVRRTFSADGSYLESQVFDRRGNLILETNAVGAVFAGSFDGLDRPRQVVGPPTTGSSGQQTLIYSYDGTGRQSSVTNAAGEFSVTITDALGRVITNAVYDVAGNLITVVTTAYGTNHHGVTTTTGTGAGAIKTTSFTDTYGKNVLSQSFPTSGVTNFSINYYDVIGNLVATRDELGRTNLFFYDAANRLKTQILPDGATINFGYNAAGSMTNRAMPGGLTWTATYDAVNRIANEQLFGNGQSTRQFTYQYYSSGSNVSLLEKKIDLGRNVTNSFVYDAYLRMSTNKTRGNLPDQNVTLAYFYDRAGQATNLFQYWGTTVASNQLIRKFDGYGQITNETILIGGVPQSEFIQNWDVAGRRSQLAQASAGTGGSIAFRYRADGAMTNVAQGGYNFAFRYSDSGLMTLRSNSWRVLSITQRDGRGRILLQTNKVGSTSVLAETLTWRANSTLDDYTGYRSSFTDSRDFTYNSRGQLTGDTLRLWSDTAINNQYAYDPGKLGVLTNITESSPINGRWRSAPLDNWGRIQIETNSTTSLSFRANGLAYNASSVALLLDDGAEVGWLTPNFTSGVDEGKWWGGMMLAPGPHKLKATATYDAGQFTASVTNYFTVIGTNTVLDYYDGAGNVTNRVFVSGKVQSLGWDGFGRLASIIQRDTPTNGFNWTATYDGLGRRLRTVQIPVVNGQTNSVLTITNDSYFDPGVEFLELAVAQNGKRTWKVYGPDLSGSYGGMQGLGGFEGTIRESDGAGNGLLNDYFGNAVATIGGSTVTWADARVSGYGPVIGFEPPVLSAGVSPGEAAVWRGQRADPSGFYCLGARYYDFAAGRFLSPDPGGHAASMDLYSFCSGDPINQFDADGRFGKSLAYGVRNALDNGSDFLSGAWNGAGYWASSTYASWGNTLDSALFAVVNPWSPLTATRNFGGGYEPDPSYMRNFEEGSSIYQAGHYFGYYGAEFGFQASLALGASAFEGIASAASLNRARSMAVTGFEARSMLAADWQAAQSFAPEVLPSASSTITASSGAGQAVIMNINAAAPSLGDRVTTAYQQFMNEGWQRAVRQFVAGDVRISSGQNAMTVLGQRTDAFARTALGRWADQQGLSDQVLINRRLYDPSGSGLYRIPDVRIPSENLILDGTIGTKTPLTPQIQDFLKWSSGRVRIVNPTITPVP